MLPISRDIFHLPKDKDQDTHDEGSHDAEYDQSWVRLQKRGFSEHDPELWNIGDIGKVPEQTKPTRYRITGETRIMNTQKIAKNLTILLKNIFFSLLDVC